MIKINSKKKQAQDKYERIEPHCEVSEKLEYHMKLEKQLRVRERFDWQGEK